jgi:murein DD-endopeptidase MepM/ murein hydrolase activator NlpD
MDIPGLEVKFAREVELRGGVFPVQSIRPYEELEAELSSQVPKTIIYEAYAGEEMAEIARKNGITTTRLQELNPNIDSGVNVLGQDTRLVVAENEPLLRVKTVRVEERTEDIPFEILIVNNDQLVFTQSFIKVPGESGERLVKVEIEYVDGERVSEVEVERKTTRLPVAQEVVNGTKDTGGSSGVSDSMFQWPTASYTRVTRGFRYPDIDHTGIDIAAPTGTMVYAAAEGVVVAAGYDGAYGNTVLIDHGNGYKTRYAHHDSNYVELGAKVGKGQLIAFVGNTGRSTGPHLHFEVHLNGERIDPGPFIGYLEFSNQR